MKDTEHYISLFRKKYPHLSDEKISELYNMIDTLAYLMVEEYDEEILIG